MSKLKAYHVFVYDPFESGSIMVFETTRGRAKMRGMVGLGGDYIEVSALRVPEFDKCIKGDKPREFWDQVELNAYAPDAPIFWQDAYQEEYYNE